MAGRKPTWTSEKIIAELQARAVDGVVSIGNETVRRAAVLQLGSWQNACRAAGVQCRSRGRAATESDPVANVDEIERGRRVLEAWGIDYEAARG